MLPRRPSETLSYPTPRNSKPPATRPTSRGSTNTWGSSDATAGYRGGVAGERAGSGAAMTLRRGWRVRYWLARGLINAGIRVLPACRYKRDLLDRMYELRWHVEDSVRAERGEQ